MKRSQIVDLLEWHPSMVDGNPGGLLSRIENIIEVAVAAERQACVQFCEDHPTWSGSAIAKEMRQRGSQ